MPGTRPPPNFTGATKDLNGCRVRVEFDLPIEREIAASSKCDVEHFCTISIGFGSAFHRMGRKIQFNFGVRRLLVSLQGTACQTGALIVVVRLWMPFPGLGYRDKALIVVVKLRLSPRPAIINVQVGKVFWTNENRTSWLTIFPRRILNTNHFVCTQIWSFHILFFLYRDTLRTGSGSRCRWPLPKGALIGPGPNTMREEELEVALKVLVPYKNKQHKNTFLSERPNLHGSLNQRRLQKMKKEKESIVERCELRVIEEQCDTQKIKNDRKTWNMNSCGNK